MMLFIFPALYLMSSARGGEKKKCHTSEEIGKVNVRRLLEGHVKNYQVAFRMEPRIFRELANYLMSNHGLHSSKAKSGLESGP